MAFNDDELLKAAEILAQNKEMKVTMAMSLKSALLTGGTTFLGGLLLGPVGLALGGAVGGVGSMMATKDKFKPVAEIIKYDLTPKQREQFVCHLRNSVKDLDITDLINLSILVLQHNNLQSAIESAIRRFFSQQLGLALKA